jgi:hypothetical protein
LDSPESVPEDRDWPAIPGFSSIHTIGFGTGEGDKKNHLGRPIVEGVFVLLEPRKNNEDAIAGEDQRSWQFTESLPTRAALMLRQHCF